LARRHKELKKKIASLSALGAGALVFGVGKADANIIYSGLIDAHVGYGPGASNFYQSPGFGSHSATFAFFKTNGSFFSAPPSSINARLIAAYGCGCLQLAQNSGFLQTFVGGAQWTSGLVPGSSLLIGGRLWGTIRNYGVPTNTVTASPATTTTTQHPVIGVGLAPFTDKYALFQFFDGPNTLYGWIHLSYSVDPQIGPDPAFGPDLFITDWAYEDSGQPIAAGAIPEPGTASTFGLAALALGAVGLRKWRKARTAA